MGDGQLLERYHGDAVAAAHMARLRDAVRASRATFVHLDPDGTDICRVTVPVNPWRIRDRAPRDTHGPAVTTDALRSTVAAWDELLVATAGRMNSVHVRAGLHDAAGAPARRLTVRQLAWVDAEVRRTLRRARVEAGMLVGAIAAHAIGEPCTQMTLNTFHKAGIKSKTNITLGVQRFKELIDATPNMSTPITYVFLKPHLQPDKGAAELLAASLVHRRLAHLVTAATVVDTSAEDTADERTMWTLHRRTRPTLERGPWFVRIALDKRAMVTTHRMPVFDVAARLVRCVPPAGDLVWTTTNQATWWIHVWFTDAYVRGQVDKVRVEDPGERDALHRAVAQQLRGTLLETPIGGVPRIVAAEVQWRRRPHVQVDGSVRPGGEYMIMTTGNNLREIVAVSGVDPFRTFSNDIHEMSATLGIEAGTRILLHEMSTVLMCDGNYINFRPLSLLCATIARRGWMCPVSRHGLARTEQPPLLRASFEETVDVLTKAGAFNEYDECRGVTQSIFLGQVPRVGTGSVEILSLIHI